MENKSDVIASLWPIGVAVGQDQRGLLTLDAALDFFLSYWLFFFLLSHSEESSQHFEADWLVFYIINIICILYFGQRRVILAYVDNFWVEYILAV